MAKQSQIESLKMLQRSISGIRFDVMTVIINFENATAWEVARYLKRGIRTVAARISELERAGILEDTGFIRTDLVTNRPGTVFSFTGKTEFVRAQNKGFKSKYNDLVAKLTRDKALFCPSCSDELKSMLECEK